VHTYACLTGFGLSVVPFAPFVVRRIGDGSDDRVAIDHGGARQVLDPRASQAGEQVELVAEVSASPNDAAAWEIEFAGVRVEWPNQYALAASDLRGVPFELWGADGAAVFPQGPYSPPPAAEHMIGPGQTVVATDADGPLRWVDMATCTTAPNGASGTSSRTAAGWSPARHGPQVRMASSRLPPDSPATWLREAQSA
jgi:hypothetical protein